jgi:hypothetical protein
MTNEELLWKATGAATGIAAGFVTRQALNLVWKQLTGNEPPEQPAGPRTTWVEAVTWAAASGVTVAVMRLVAERGAAGAWKAATGSYPAPVADGRDA